MKKIYLLLAFSLAALTVSAQNLRTGYFLDGYSYRYQFNPAFQGDRGFISLPAISKISVGMESSMAIKDFLYPTSSGTLGLFLHPDVSDKDAMRNLGHNTMASANLDLNILGFGFRVKKSYHTFDISLKGNADVTIPGELFKFLKVGAGDGNATYDLSDFGLSSQAYAQIAYGFSRTFLDKFNLGIRVKALMGVETIKAKFSDFTMKMDANGWMIKTAGKATASSIPASYIGSSKEVDVIEELLKITKGNNLGFAVDLGFSMDLWEYLTVSAAILDLGAINWNDILVYDIAPNPWVFNGFKDNININGSGNINDQLQNELEGFKDIIRPEDLIATTKKNHLERLAITTHIGAEARLPFYERLSAGILATHKFNGAHSWTEGRFSINWALLRWFSLAANYAISDFGQSYGAAVNLHPKGFSLFLGTDSFRPVTKFATNMLPLNDLNTNVVLGLNFPFGKYNGRFPKKERKEKKKD